MMKLLSVYSGCVTSDHKKGACSDPVPGSAHTPLHLLNNDSAMQLITSGAMARTVVMIIGAAANADNSPHIVSLYTIIPRNGQKTCDYTSFGVYLEQEVPHGKE
jgi:hypothetical protein